MYIFDNIYFLIEFQSDSSRRMYSLSMRDSILFLMKFTSGLKILIILQQSCTSSWCFNCFRDFMTRTNWESMMNSLSFKIYFICWDSSALINFCSCYGIIHHFTNRFGAILGLGRILNFFCLFWNSICRVRYSCWSNSSRSALYLLMIFTTTKGIKADSNSNLYFMTHVCLPWIYWFVSWSR